MIKYVCTLFLLLNIIILNDAIDCSIPSNDGVDCSGGKATICTEKICKDGKCQVQATDNAICGIGGECYERRCSGTKCVIKNKEDNSPCGEATNTECIINACQGGACRTTQLEVGASCGGTSSCVSGTCNVDGGCDVTNTDTTPPNIICPVDQDLSFPIDSCSVDTSTDVTGNAVVDDDCSSSLSAVSSDSITDDVGDGYTITREFVVTDDAGNSDSCIQLIRVRDTTKPLVHVSKTLSFWPPDRKMEKIQLETCLDGVILSDNCNNEENLKENAKFSPVVLSNEEIVESNDYKFINENEIHVLKAKTNRQDRIYTLQYTFSDASNNQGTGACYIRIENNRGKSSFLTSSASIASGTVILVAIALGAIVLSIKRKRRNTEEDDENMDEVKRSETVSLFSDTNDQNVDIVDISELQSIPLSHSSKLNIESHTTKEGV